MEKSIDLSHVPQNLRGNCKYCKERRLSGSTHYCKKHGSVLKSLLERSLNVQRWGNRFHDMDVAVHPLSDDAREYLISTDPNSPFLRTGRCPVVYLQREEDEPPFSYWWFELCSIEKVYFLARWLYADAEPWRPTSLDTAYVTKEVMKEVLRLLKGEYTSDEERVREFLSVVRTENKSLALIVIGFL